MNFNETKSIYLQITDYISDKIVNTQLISGDRIPSIRELGAELEVNPNTIIRSYEWLSERKIILNKRGVGYFVCDRAREIIVEYRREEIMGRELKSIAQAILQLGITTDEVIGALDAHISDLLKNKQ